MNDSEQAVTVPDFELEILTPTAEDRQRLSLHGKNLAYIGLLTGEPEKYRVTVSGSETRYLADVKLFYAVVDENISEGELMEKIVVERK